MRGEAIKLYTSHWGSALLPHVDAVMVAISRGKPRWKLAYRYRVVSELAPSDEAWAMKDWESFEAAYGRQLEELGPEWILERLAGIGDGRACVLLCWEKPDDEWCHRWQLADFIQREAGVEIRELRAGDVGRRPDAPQPALFDRAKEDG